MCLGVGALSTCKRILDLLEPGDLRLGEVVVKRVAVVKLGVNGGSGDGGSCFGTEVWMHRRRTAFTPSRHSCLPSLVKRVK